MMKVPMMNLKMAWLMMVLILGFGPGIRAHDEPAPVWEWKAADAADGMFDGERSLAFPEVRERYVQGEGFTVEVRCKPADIGSLMGIVSDYGGPKEGGWYLSTGGVAPFTRPRVVIVTDKVDGYRSFNAVTAMKPGQWHTLTLVYDQKVCTLYVDEREAGSLTVEQPLPGSLKGTFLVGSRGKDGFKGEIESVRLWAQPIRKPEAPTEVDRKKTSGNYIANSSFEDGDRMEEVLLWHRMTESDSGIASVHGWEIDSKVAFHGKRSLKGRHASPLLLMEEVWEKVEDNKSWVFSVYLKADRDGVACDLSVGAYGRLEEQTVSSRVELSTEWKRYEVVAKKIPQLYRRATTIQGPVSFHITPQGEATVWVDAVQWAPGNAEYSDQGPEAVAAETVPLEFPEMETSIRPAGKGSWSGSVPLQVWRNGTAESGQRQPVTVTVPFNREQWDGRGTLKLRNAQGRELELQSEVLTAWGGDKGVQVLGLFFTDTLAAGWQSYTLEVTPDAVLQEASEPEALANAQWQVVKPTAPGQLWSAIADVKGQPLFEAGSLHGIGWDGAVYDSEWDKEALWKLERSGSLYRVYRGTGRLVGRDGRVLLGYVARLHWWRDVPGLKLEVSLVNARESGSIRLRSLYWHAREGTNQKKEHQKRPAEQRRMERSVIYRPKTGAFVLREEKAAGVEESSGREPLVLKASVGEARVSVHALEAWQRHPSQLAWENGEWRGYFWPEAGIRGLLFPRGLALTREFWLRESHAEDAPEWDSDPIGMAAPQWWAKTDVLIPFFAADADRFPFMESRLNPQQFLQRMGPQALESSRAYGLFDYGDLHGDGGWANLESFMDWAAFLGGLRSGDVMALAAGLRAAKHYRDIDMNQLTGACYVHNLNHVTGRTDLSHSWPGGVVAHYLLTGSKRSAEVALLHGEYLLAMDAAALAKGLRSLGRYLTNLVDVYQLTGDERFRKRFFEQVRMSRDLLASDKENPDRSIFSYLGNSERRRLVPFHAWYGISALQKMESLTNDPALSAFIAEEIAATLNRELYVLDLEELWPGIAPERGMPLMLADYARHRGSFFYPVMIAHAARAKRPDAAELALQSLYCGTLEGRGASRVETILSSAGLWGATEGETERERIASARALLWEGAAPTLLNGDFSQSPDYWHHWRPFPGKSLSYHTNWQERRKMMAALDSNVHKNGPRSLRLNLARVAFRQTIRVDTHRFRLEPGEHRLRGSVRWDAGAIPPVIGLEVSDLNGNFGAFRVETQSGAVTNKQEAIRQGEINISSPDAQGWREVTIGFSLSKRAVANLMVSCTLKDNASEGYLWMDGFRLDKAPEAKRNK